MKIIIGEEICKCNAFTIATMRKQDSQNKLNKCQHLFSPFDSWLCKKKHHFWTLIYGIYSILEVIFPSPARYCHLEGTVIETSKDHHAVLSSQLFSYNGEHGKTSEFHEHDEPIAAFHLLCREFLDQKQYCKSTDSNFGRTIVCREGKSKSSLE